MTALGQVGTDNLMSSRLKMLLIEAQDGAATQEEVGLAGLGDQVNVLHGRIGRDGTTVMKRENADRHQHIFPIAPSWP